MFRGFLAGVIWSAFCVALVVCVASLMAPLPATVTPQVSAVETTTGSAKQDSSGVALPSTADESLGGEVAGVVEAEASEDDDTPLADTDPAPRPNPTMEQEALVAPEAQDAVRSVGGGATESPVTPAPQARAPEAPGADMAVVPDADRSITTNPDQPAAPAVPEVGSAFETPRSETDMTPGAEEAETGAPAAVMKPAGSLTESFPQHKSSRLPTVGSEESADAAPRPFDVNAMPFEAEAGKPLMSVVLMDDGSVAIDEAKLTSLPFPVSFAIDTLAEDAAARETMYREMGYETLAMMNMPAAAAASDVEVAMEVHLAALPGAVAVLEGTGEGLQGSREVSDQITQVLLSSGHGLVMFANGLNTAQKLASREGVPAATVFRDFDGKGQNIAVIRRFLDQAAFKADQEGGVIMVGRLREETLSALMLWGLQDRASSVSLAPVSAVLRDKAQ